MFVCLGTVAKVWSFRSIVYVRPLILDEYNLNIGINIHIIGHMLVCSERVIVEDWTVCRFGCISLSSKD